MGVRWIRVLWNAVKLCDCAATVIVYHEIDQVRSSAKRNLDEHRVPTVSEKLIQHIDAPSKGAFCFFPQRNINIFFSHKRVEVFMQHSAVETRQRFYGEATKLAPEWNQDTNEAWMSSIVVDMSYQGAGEVGQQIRAFVVESGVSSVLNQVIGEVTPHVEEQTASLVLRNRFGLSERPDGSVDLATWDTFEDLAGMEARARALAQEAAAKGEVRLKESQILLRREIETLIEKKLAEIEIKRATLQAAFFRSATVAAEYGASVNPLLTEVTPEFSDKFKELNDEKNHLIEMVRRVNSLFDGVTEKTARTLSIVAKQSTGYTPTSELQIAA